MVAGQQMHDVRCLPFDILHYIARLSPRRSKKIPVRDNFFTRQIQVLGAGYQRNVPHNRAVATSPPAGV